jgi:hypothetical protein
VCAFNLHNEAVSVQLSAFADSDGWTLGLNIASRGELKAES